MPLLNGIEAFYEIREYEENQSLNPIPVVALTANAIKGDREKFISLGMNDYLSKPINLYELEKILQKYT
jgi:CheY-like chemotaxis protein